MSGVNFRAERLMVVGIPALLTSYMLFRADQRIFGMSSDFLGGFVTVIGVAFFVTGAALSVRSRRLGS